MSQSGKKNLRTLFKISRSSDKITKSATPACIDALIDDASDVGCDSVTWALRFLSMQNVCFERIDKIR